MLSRLIVAGCLALGSTAVLHAADGPVPQDDQSPRSAEPTKGEKATATKIRVILPSPYEPREQR